ncbi:UDP-N-acetyl-D-glucosamine dehydrogenase [Kordiimonas sediminis]|uniref:UDP-N-acetyl-D-glucosamine dehydrogenase n=1 Tax=Kordiimonas sediminis TaxID=1735581 RepID=A0A919AVQ5_9PROT|nr:nucleotide sugar dehydrogenase [Kordiimonas sediminis]GHF25456.1 UDP-N-acetyl-D-glucosamine dehydrogenase [Kordiimonas sediminis]
MTLENSREVNNPLAQELLKKIESKNAVIGIMGLGYVGLPLAIAFCKSGMNVIGFDIDDSKIASIEAGKSYIKTIPSEPINSAVKAGLLTATSSADFVERVDAIIMCVPTPLNKYREPDLSYVEKTAEIITPYLRKGQVVSLESTTYPGTTDEIVRQIVEKSGLKTGEDIFLIYSPEREDPGNLHFSTSTTPKVVGGENDSALAVGIALYSKVVRQVVPVSSPATAEAVKLTENIFRAVNIALVNELKVLFEKMGIDIWEVVDAAKTKPFGYMPFYPGPGLGGHCIPIDPFYLTWKAREFGITTRFIELAGQINNAMPDYVISRLKDGIDARLKRSLNGSKILLVGIAYKKDVDDIRESPSFPIYERLEAAGANVDYYDPFVPEIPMTREHAGLAGIKSVTWEDIPSKTYDAALICTDHSTIDYAYLADNSALIVDTRNATKDLTQQRDKIIKA